MRHKTRFRIGLKAVLGGVRDDDRSNPIPDPGPGSAKSQADLHV